MSTPTHANPVIDQVPQYVQQALPYKPGKPLEEIKQEYGLEHIIKLASNENPFGPSPMALKAMQQVETDLFRYPDPISRRLKAKLAQKLGVNADEIIVGAGSESLLSILIRTVMQPGQWALAPEGAFLGFKVHLASFGGQLKTVPSPNYRFDVDALIAAITPDIKLIYLPNPNNPTGTYLSTAEVEKLIAATPKHIPIVLDEAYVEFCSHLPDFPNSISLRQDNIIILRTFSKAYGLAGLRVGYGIAPAALIEQLGKIKMTFEVSLLAQTAAEAALEDTAHLKQTVENNNSQAHRYYELFKAKGIPVVESCGNFVLMALKNEEQVNQLNEDLLKQGIAIRPLRPFGFPSCARISIGTAEENTTVIAALQQLL